LLYANPKRKEIVKEAKPEKKLRCSPAS